MDGLARGLRTTTETVAPGVTLAPVPPWVDLPPVDIPLATDERFVVSGVCVLLESTQISLLDAVPAEFMHRADKVVDISGAEHVARFTAEFDPADERIEIHFIRIHRNGEILVRGAPTDFEVIRRERNLEMRRFDGRLTVLMEISDVRVGDVVEVAWTLYGQPEALKGRYAGWRIFEWNSAGQIETRFRLLAPNTRPITTKVFGGAAPTYAVTEADNVLDRRWVVKGREGRRIEPLAPPWMFQLTRLQITEWRTWSEIVEAFWPLYEEADPMPPELAVKADALAALPTPQERAAALLRFVQAEIRYLAISMGPGGLVPRSLAAIWETRYGDCKDVTKLFVHLARRVGLNAVPALVHTEIGEALGELLPTAAAFNHALIRLDLDGRPIWLDATMPAQPCPLEVLSQPRLGYALPLRAGGDALEHMGEEPLLTLLESEEIIRLPLKVADPADYRWTLTFRGWRAEQMRAEIGRHGEPNLFRRYEERLQSVWPKATLGSRSIEDDPAANRFSLVMSFAVPEAWQELDAGLVRFVTMDTVFGHFFAPLDPAPLKLPIYLGPVGRTARTVVVHLPVDWLTPAWSQTVVDDAAGVNITFASVSPREYRLDQEVKVRKTTMPPEGAEKYRDMVKELRAMDVRFETQVKGGKVQNVTGSAGGGLAWLWWTLGGLWALLMFGAGALGLGQ